MMKIDATTHISKQHTPLSYKKRDGKTPYIVFLSGFMSDMEGSKATFLDAFCATHGYGFLRFDYMGHGSSGGTFTDGTISLWLSNVLEMLDAHTQGNVILVGSSMGGWLMLQAARQRRERISGLIGIAAAPDFTQELMWDAFTPQQRTDLQTNGNIMIASEYDDDYPITMALIEDGNNQSFFHAPPLSISCPVALLHGMQDVDVPWEYALRIAEHIDHDRIDIHLVKDGDHRLSRIEDLQKLVTIIERMIQSATLDSNA